MRIAIYAPDIWVYRGYEHLAPPEAAIPFRAATVLSEAGHDVSLITTAPQPQRDGIPSCSPPTVPVFHVDPTQSAPPSAPISRLYRPLVPLASVRMAEQLRTVAQNLSADVLHVFGNQRDARVAALVKLVGFSMPVVASLTNPWREYGMAHAVIAKRLMRRLNAVTVATSASKAMLAAEGVDAHVVRHGPSPLPDLPLEAGEGPKDDMVLYWGYASKGAGCDVALDVFRQLAPQNPDRTFAMAILIRWEEVMGLDEVAAEHPNIEVYRFPHQFSPRIEDLVGRASCTLLPYRKYWTDPPGELLTSLGCGSAVVTTELASTPEIAPPTRSALLVPGDDVPAARDTLAKLLEGGEDLQQSLSRDAMEHVGREWSWEHYAPRMDKVYEAAMKA